MLPANGGKLLRLDAGDTVPTAEASVATAGDHMSFICRRLKEASEISRFEMDDLMSQNCLLQYVLSRELSGLASEVLHLVRKGALRRKIDAAVVFVCAPSTP